MIIKTDSIYSFSEVVHILGVSPQRLFELIANPSIEKVYRKNRIFFSKSSVRKLVLWGDDKL